MSFITKRERVFNEYDLFDLPARNEGKLKAYASCTDARAWSHFCSDKSEHLVEIIKRNNQTVRPKYIPTDVIVNTLMSAKNAEIARLKRKIEEFEQMITAYDQLDLTSEQKGDIANAHAAIKAANKELDDMCLDLDLSGYTEGIDSEAFETGKSRGDEPLRYNLETERSGRDGIKTRFEEWNFEKEKRSTPRKETKSSQAGPPCTCDASTSAHDTQVDEMQETIISKDAKLSAMQNTLAVMEHDVCEPYCVYAHIYTALEKIFGTLCQNGKYKQYLDLLTAGKDTRGIDIKGKILFKMKVLEKFSLALIAPCSQEFSRASKDCSCYRAEVVTTFALTSAESQKPSLDSKRAQLVADIMGNQEMKEILSKESLGLKVEDDQFEECFAIDSCNADVENLNRLKNLQANYDELLTCYDNLKHERDCLFIRCQKYADLELECESLKNNLREYNELWKEKEYFRKRSEDLDTLKENYFILSEETSNVETKFKSEQEINKKKSEMIDQLRKENIKLEQNIADASVLFEKQKNILICKLKECECKIMCQDQQIKGLSEQIDKLLEEDKNKMPSNEDSLRSVELIDEIEFQKEQIKNLKDDLCCSEEEKQYLQEEFEKKLELINELKLDVEDWKSRYEEVLKNCNYLQMQVDELQDRNLFMNQELENKTSAIDNLNHIICTKSREISNLLEEVDHKRDENVNLLKQMENSRESSDQNMALLLNERKNAINAIINARQESINLLKHLKNNKNSIDQSTLSKSETQSCDKNTDNYILVKELELLHDTNLKNINILQNQNDQLKKMFDIAKNESLLLEQRLLNHENLLERFEKMQKSHDDLLKEKGTLQLELNRCKLELDSLFHDFELTKKKSESLLDESEDMKEQYSKLHIIYQKVLHERNILQKKTFEKDLEMNDLIRSLQSLKLERENFLSKLQEIPKLEKKLIELRNKYEQLLSEKNTLQSDLGIKTAEINTLYKNLETKIEENQRLENEIKRKQSEDLAVNESISSLKNDNYIIHLDLDSIQKENALLLDKMKHYEHIANLYEKLQESHDQIKLANKNLQKELNDLKKNQQENHEYSNRLEIALICSRENISTTGSKNDFYSDLKIEVEKLKEEKLKNHREMKSLMEKLDESEFLITNLNEDIWARDKRISTLENHINELQVEIAALQKNLKEVVESGEELNQLSFEKLDESFKRIEAHQSKATHNMKIEIAKLRNEKENLENKLSLTAFSAEESDKEKNKYNTVISQLKNERELIIKDIKQLEISTLGDSNILPSNCSINEVLISLDRIGKYITNKNYSLEQTLRNVQTSSQLLKSKADEAKNIAEKEQQRIICEKELLRKERTEVEKQLEVMKNKIKEEKAKYEKLIKDLESENLNQQLIFEKITQSKEDHKLKLIDENQRLRDQCNSYDIKVKEIKEKLQFASKQISEKSDLIENANKSLEYKETLVIELQKQIDNLKQTPATHEASIQTILYTAAKDEACQTDVNRQEKLAETSVNAIHCEDANIINRNTDKSFTSIDVFNEENHQKKHQGILEKHPINLPISKVQILTVNVEPEIDLARNIYLKYKLKRLSPGKLEQHSIASLDDVNGLSPSDKILSEVQTDPKSESPKKNNTTLNQNKESIIDIYNTQFLSNSTKISGDIYMDTSNKECDSPISDLENKNTHFKNENISSTLKNKETDVNLKASLQSSEKDLFVIYKESDSIYEEQSSPENLKNMTSKLTKRQNKFKQFKVENSYSHENTFEDRDDDSMKPKLQINLPRFINDNSSVVTNSDDDKKSLDSCALPLWEEQSYSYEDSKAFGLNLFSMPSLAKNQIKEIFPDNTSIQQYFDNLGQKSIVQSYTVIDYPANNEMNITHNSNHKLARVGAKILVLQNTNDMPSQDVNIKSNFGLQYILNTVQNEINPNNIENFNLTLRKSRSDESDEINVSESSQSKDLSEIKLSSVEHGTVSIYSPLPETKVDRGILVKLDDKEHYENKIREMSNALENIEKHYTKKIEAIKTQYDNNVKSIINEHNHGVRSIQNLHEETLQDVKKFHENEVENLRTMSFEAMRKVEKLQIENRCLKSKFNDDTSINLLEEPTKICSPDSKRRKCRCRMSSRTLTKTNVEAFNVRPRRRSHGPCTCSLDMSISGSIRNIFEQVDVEQRKMGERAYLKYIVNKILDGNVEALDAQELSFLHLKVCRTWKTKFNIEEVKQIKIEALETEWNNKQRENQKHIAELDRQVAEERRRLQEVREALCFSVCGSRHGNAETPARLVGEAEKDITCSFTTAERERRSGDLTSGPTSVIATTWKRKRGKLETSKAVIPKMDVCEGRRGKALVTDETPTRMRRVHDRHSTRTHKK